MIESPCIVVAPKFLSELNKLPEDVLSFAAAIQDVWLAVGIRSRVLLTDKLAAYAY